MKKLLKDDNDKIYGKLATDLQVDLCDYVLINDVKFKKVSEMELAQENKSYDFGHGENCNCFLCSH